MQLRPQRPYSLLIDRMVLGTLNEMFISSLLSRVVPSTRVYASDTTNQLIDGLMVEFIARMIQNSP